MSFAGIVAYQSILRLLTEDNAYARSSFSFNPVIELSCGLYRDRDSINEIHVYRAYRFSNWSRQLGTFVYAQSPFLSGRPFLISSICSYTLLRCLEIGLKISSRYKRIEFRSRFAFQSYQFVVRVTNQCSNQCSDITTFLSLTVFIFHKQFVVFLFTRRFFSFHEDLEGYFFYFLRDNYPISTSVYGRFNRQQVPFLKPIQTVYNKTNSSILVILLYR